MQEGTKSEKLLIIEDDDQLRSGLSEALQLTGIPVDTAPEGESALEALCEERYAVAIVDLNLPGIGGLETIAHMSEISPDTQVIILTGDPTLDSAQLAIQHHVFDYLVKPVSLDKLQKTVGRAFEAYDEIREKEDVLEQLFEERALLEERIKVAEEAIYSRLKASQLLLGHSESIRNVRQQIAMVAPSSMTVLIVGESGAGKDVVANLIHQYSGRSSSNRMVKVNCPAVPETLIESEFFGHEDGAFTGATKRKPGRFDLADGGTIFLDEIGSITLPMQAKLLQVIEHKKFTRVGGSAVVDVDARIVAATNSPLEAEMAEGRFRTDLYYRLKQFTITLPPLRERREDIPLLIDTFLRRACRKYGQTQLSLPMPLRAALQAYDWPGNVRELVAMIERFALTGEERILREMIEGEPEAPEQVEPSNVLHESEASIVLRALITTNWNRRRAAQDLGISYSALRRRIEKFELLDPTERLKSIVADA